MTRVAERVLAAIAAVAAVGIALYQLVYYFPRTVDDTFISLRYAERFAGGHGLTYNPGERVEGFSSPLWLGVQSLGYLLSAEGVTWTKIASITATLLLFAAAARYARRRLRVPWLVVWLTLAALAACSYLMSWAMLGLETPLYLALLVAWPLTLGLHLERATRPSAVLAAVTGSALAIARPEAPLFVVALGAAAVLSVRRTAWRRAVAPAIAVAAFTGLVFAARRVYFGLWLPHTYYAKRGDGFNLQKLEALWAEGAQPAEVLVLGLGAAAALWLAARRRELVPLAALTTCLVFVASVERDWMPSQRHVLPIWIFALLSLGAALGALLDGARRRRLALLPAIALAAVAAWCAAFQVSIDSRYSPKDFASHGRGRNWHRPKTAKSWADVTHALRRETPPHVLEMPLDGMGMIDQVFRVFEASAEPLSESWYIGRDIGRFGYFAPDVKVFDTDGLFTPAVVADPDWRNGGKVTPALARQAFALRPLAAELFDRWPAGAGVVVRGLRDYNVVAGSRYHPISVIRRDPRPSPRQVLERYQRAIDRFPKSYFLATLYGESVGAAFQRRFEWVERTFGAQRSFVVARAPEGLPGAGVELDRVIRFHGCRASATSIAPGKPLRLACYFEAMQQVARDYRVFLHWVDQSGAHIGSSDHRPCSGLLPTPEWKRGAVVEDLFETTLSSRQAGRRLRAHVGLFHANHRARARPVEKTDGKDRVPGPVIDVTN